MRKVIIPVLLLFVMMTTALAAPSASADNNATRGDVVFALWESQGSPAPNGDSTIGDYFTDCDSDGDFPAALWAAQNVILRGHEDGTARLDSLITREEAITMFYRSNCITGDGFIHDVEAYKTFRDAGNIGQWAKDAISWATENGVVKGYNSDPNNMVLGPKDYITNTQVGYLCNQMTQAIQRNLSSKKPASTNTSTPATDPADHTDKQTTSTHIPEGYIYYEEFKSYFPEYQVGDFRINESVIASLTASFGAPSIRTVECTAYGSDCNPVTFRYDVYCFAGCNVLDSSYDDKHRITHCSVRVDFGEISAFCTNIEAVKAFIIYAQAV